MFEQLMTSVMKADFWFSVLRITAPILFAALAAVIARVAVGGTVGDAAVSGE